MSLEETLTCARRDQRPAARGAGRGHRRLGHPRRPRRDQGHRPAAVHPGVDGAADEGRPREAGDDPHRRGPAGVVDPQRRGPEAGRRSSPPRAPSRPRSSTPRPSGSPASCAPRVSGPPRYLQAQGQAKAIEKVFAAIKAGQARRRSCWPTSTCRRCRRWRRATPTRCGWCRSDFGKALEGFTQMLGAPGDDGVFRYEPSPVDDDAAGRPEDDDEAIKDWFDTSSDPEIARVVADAEAQARAEIPPSYRTRRHRSRGARGAAAGCAALAHAGASCRSAATAGWGCPPGPTTTRRSGPRRVTVGSVRARARVVARSARRGSGRRRVRASARRIGLRLRRTGRPRRRGRAQVATVARRRAGPTRHDAPPTPRSGPRRSRGWAEPRERRAHPAARRPARRRGPRHVEHVNPARPGYPSPPRSPRN